MKEFMLFIRNQKDHQSGWPEERHQEFLKQCETYISELKKDHQLIAAQPLVREGKMISGSNDHWTEGPFSDSNEVLVGYYHIMAKDIEDAISIAKRNPEFKYSTTARIEVRPVRVKEESTGFVYPEK